MLADRHEVGVVLHEHAHAQEFAEPLPHREVVPARHPRRRDDLGRRGIHGSGHADTDTQERQLFGTGLTQRRADVAGQPLGDLLGPFGDFAGEFVFEDDAAGQVHDRHAHVVGAHVGADHDARVLVQAKVSGAPAATGGAFAVLAQEPRVYEFLHPQGNARRRHAAQSGELRT